MNINELADRHVGHAEEDDEDISVTQQRNSFKWGMLTALKEAWKDAQGEDLPEYDREVVVFIQNFRDDAGMMSVAIGHRPNPKGWDGKSLSTGKVEHYTPMTYDNGGWNQPDVRWWLDIPLPYED